MTLPEDEKQRCEKFLNYFNQITAHLREILHKDETVDYPKLVDLYVNKHTSWQADKSKLIAIGKLRNNLVHDRVKPYQYLAIPTEELIHQLASYHQRIVNPQKAIKRFKRKVEFAYSHENIKSVFDKIVEFDYSQFPIVNDEKIVGLLTENGITRWLASYTTSREEIIDFTDHSIAEVLEKDENAQNYKFISPHMPVYEVIEMFSDDLLLEAAIITKDGQERRELQGIATRWDIIEALKEK